MTNITLVKTIPTSYAYSGGGLSSPTSITLTGVQQFTLDTKNDRVSYPINKTNWRNDDGTIGDPTDSPVIGFIDIQGCTEVIKLTGWLEDDAIESAWNKLWKLRAMETSGGPLYTLTIGSAVPLIFPTPNPLTQDNLNTSSWNTGDPDINRQQKFIPYAFLDHVMAIIEPDDTGDITASFSAHPARIKVDLDFSLGVLQY